MCGNRNVGILPITGHKIGNLSLRLGMFQRRCCIIYPLSGGRDVGDRRTVPKDLSYLSYVDVWLPNDAPLVETNKAAQRAERIIRDVTTEYGKEVAKEGGHEGQVLKSLTTFVGGGGPRFWFSVSPELQQLNYAQIIIEVNDKHDTSHLVDRIQAALSAGVPGAQVDVRQLESGASVGIPVSIRISGENIATLRRQAEQLKQIFHNVPMARRVRDDWGSIGLNVVMETYNDRANLAGITNYDVASSSSAATSGSRITTLREGDKQIPVVTKLRMEERATLSDLQNLYIGSSEGTQKSQSVKSHHYTQKLDPRNCVAGSSSGRSQFRPFRVRGTYLQNC